MGSTTPDWSINNTVVNESHHTENLSCITMSNALSFLTVIIVMVGLVGNAIVLWLLGFHMHRNAFSVYVLNLAGADFLYLCTQIVYFLNCVLQLHINYNYFLIVLIFAYFASMCMIATISAERCLSVMWPIWYHCQRPRHVSAILCALLWAFSLLLCLLLWLSCAFLPSHYRYSFCRASSFIIAAFLIVLFVVISVSTLTLVVKIICGSHRIPVTRFYVTITLTVVVFLVFGLPFGISWFLLWWIKELQRILPYDIIISLSCVNSCANPIIYFLVGSIRHRRLQRQTLKLLLQRAMQDTPEEESGERRGPSQRSGELETVCHSS